MIRLYEGDLITLYTVALCFLSKVVQADDTIIIEEKCQPGTTWNNGTFKYQCYDEAGLVGYRPIACLTEDKTELSSGQFFSNFNFKYHCQIDPYGSKSLYSIVSCYTANHTEMNPGTKLREGDYNYTCSMQNSNVTLSFVKVKSCDYHGTEKFNDEYWVNPEKTEGYICGATDKFAKIHIVACIPPISGKFININGFGPDGDNFYGCHLNQTTNTAYLTLLPNSTCVYGGETHKLGEKWIVGNIQYLCHLSDWDRTIILTSCIVNGNVVGAGSTVNVNGVFYQCKQPVQNCSLNGHSFPIHSTYDYKNIRRFCLVSPDGNKTFAYNISCVTNSGKDGYGIFEESPGVAYDCKNLSPQTNDWMELYTLSDAEYKAWKSGIPYGSISNENYYGSGASSNVTNDTTTRPPWLGTTSHSFKVSTTSQQANTSKLFPTTSQTFVFSTSSHRNETKLPTRGSSLILPSSTATPQTKCNDDHRSCPLLKHLCVKVINLSGNATRFKRQTNDFIDGSGHLIQSDEDGHHNSHEPCCKGSHLKYFVTTLCPSTCDVCRFGLEWRQNLRNLFIDSLIVE